MTYHQIAEVMLSKDFLDPLSLRNERLSLTSTGHSAMSEHLGIGCFIDSKYIYLCVWGQESGIAGIWCHLISGVFKRELLGNRHPLSVSAGSC